MLRIGIDTFTIDRPGDNIGVGRGVYVRHLLEQLVNIGAEHRFFVFCNREYASYVPQGSNIEVVTSPLPNRPRFFRPLHEQAVVPFYAKRLRLDGVHFLGNDVSFLIAHRSILTIYDLIWKYYLSRGARGLTYRYVSLTVPASIRRARGLIAISNFVSDEVQKEYGVPRERISVIPLAPGKVREVDPTSFNALQARFNYPYIFSVTASFPHKNLAMLINAYSNLRKGGAYKGKLVVAGQLKGPYLEELLALLQTVDARDDVQLLGFVDESTKAFLYRSADLIVFPSLYEGFGLPVLEAMQYGTAVLCARAASLPEVAGDAAALFDPQSLDDLVGKMESILQDRAIRERMARQGCQRVLDFSWERTAKATLEVYEKTFRQT
jgi:glycosyltransferase involved in cell wall biosynthesis